MILEQPQINALEAVRNSEWLTAQPKLRELVYTLADGFEPDLRDWTKEEALDALHFTLPVIAQLTDAPLRWFFVEVCHRLAFAARRTEPTETNWN